MGPVLLITLDTVRQDVFDSECFPQSWPTIASEFARFPNALATGVATPHSFPGIITGEPVVEDGEFTSSATAVMEFFEGETVVFTNNGHLRAERGYERGTDEFGDNQLPTNQHVSPQSFVERVKQIEPINNSTILKKAYRWYKSAKPDVEYHTPKYPAEAVTDWALSELTQKPPSFLWAHYMDAHKPFNPENAISPPDANVSKETLEYLNDYDRMDDPPEKKCRHYLKALYEANVRYVDREIARLLRELRAFDWYSDALVVLVSDHGELFGEYGHMWHPMTIDPVDELIDVPLAVKFPQGERAGKVVDHRVQHADIPATIGTYLQQTDLSPEGTYPLLDSAERIILSKSNTSIRVTGSDGHVIRRRDDSRDEYGDISDELWERAETAEFPDVRTSNGVVRGLEDVDRMEQLKALGYR